MSLLLKRNSDPKDGPEPSQYEQPRGETFPYMIKDSVEQGNGLHRKTSLH